MKALLGSLAVCAVLLLRLAAPDATAQPRRNGDPPPASPQELLRAAKSWGYQLQNIDTAKLDRTPSDVLVVDTGLAPASIQRLKSKPDGRRRIVLAYVNIGEAEDYRSYWKKSWATEAGRPEWMGSANARWQGDHRVRHWHPDWQAIVFGNAQSIFHRLIKAGFDGAYLDRVDIYQFWCSERASSFEDMIGFVEALSKWSKSQKPGFLVLPQNGEELLASAAYRAAIDGVGKEDYIFGDRGNEVQNYDTRIELQTELLSHAAKAGLPIFAIEYARNPDNQKRARELHAKLGTVLYFGPRSLAYIGQSGHLQKEDSDTEPYYAARGRRNCTE